MKLEKLSNLVLDAEKTMLSVGYATETVRGYRKIWRKYVDYAKRNGFSDCDLSTDSLLKFIDECYLGKGRSGQLCKEYRQRILRAVGILTEYQLRGKAAFAQHSDRKDYTCPEPFKSYVERYYAQKEDEGLSKSWKGSFTAEMRKFVSFLLDNSVSSFDAVTSVHISKYIKELKHYSPHMLSAVLGRLRGFFRWMYENEFSCSDISTYFPSVNRCSFPSHLPAVWKPDEIDRILSVIDRESPVGKRDYAVLLLLSKTGLRASDALFLEYSDINWESNVIEIVQSKTNTPLSIPLAEKVGLAIIDYLQNGRPQSESNCIFIRHTPPFDAFIGGHKYHYQIGKYLELAGISKPVGMSRGTHSFRHTLATEMLKQQTPLPVIAEVLGHKSVHSTANYLRVDVDQLRSCALGLEALSRD